MTPEQARQLERMIWKQRLKVLLPSVAAVLLVFGAFAWITAEKAERVDRTLKSRLVAGKVVGGARLTGRRGGFLVHVRLNDGSEVDALSALPQPPVDGEAVELRASAHASGRVTYQVVRLVN